MNGELLAGVFPISSLPTQPTGSPAIFMKLINEVLDEHLYKVVLVYLDNILIYTKTMDEQVKHIRTVFQKLCSTAHLYTN